MKIFKMIKRPLALLLAFFMMFPANLSMEAEAAGNVQAEPVVNNEDRAESNAGAKADSETGSGAAVMAIEDTDTRAGDDADTGSGFVLKIEWEESEFKKGDSYNLVEDTDTSNAVKLRVSYSNNEVMESGYQPGELIITVKGIGAVKRNGIIEAQVGADKAGSGTKNRDWTYTWSKATDTYTFTNNNAIAPNSVVSGYFDMLWEIKSRDSIQKYSQNDIIAELLLPDGTSVSSQQLDFNNRTVCDKYSIDIDRAVLYSSNGLSGGLADEYNIFIKYTLTPHIDKKSRGLIEGTDYYRFCTDYDGIGDGGIVTYSTVPYKEDGSNGWYRVSLTPNKTAGEQFVIVAYNKETYVGQEITAFVNFWGEIHEGNDFGWGGKIKLAQDMITLTVPADFDFKDRGGDTHEIKVSEYEDKVCTDKTFREQVAKKGGHILGSKMKNGDTHSFLLGVSKEGYGKDHIHTIELVDDFLYITQNDGNYRQLDVDDYDIRSVDILSTKSVMNENGMPVQSGMYPVSVYAAQNGEVLKLFDRKARPAEPENDLSMEPVFIETNDTVWANTFAPVREMPGSSQPAIGYLKSGESIKRTCTVDNGWSEVETEKGLIGYVYSEYLQTEEPVKPAELVWEGLWMDYDQNVKLPKNTTSVGIRIENVEEAIYSEWCEISNKDLLEQPIVSVNVSIHLDESELEDSQKANLVDGQLVNTSFISIYDKSGNYIPEGDTEDDYLDGDINIDLAQKDLDTYGTYLDREKGDITFYGSEKSDYKSTTDLGSIERKGNKYTAKMTMGAKFEFSEEESPDKFSLYTILPEKVSLEGYDIEEDLWNVISLKGLGLNSSTLTSHCNAEIIKNYNNSGRVYVALHFDLSGISVPNKSDITASFTVKIDKSYFKQSKSNVNVRSAVMLDKSVNIYTIGKRNDDGEWDVDKNISCDIDRDNETLEFLAYSYDYSTYTYVDSSELQMSKSVKASSVKDYVQLPEVPMAEQGSEYSYELTLQNGNGNSRNLVVTDILETGENAEWKGTFKEIDMSEADDMKLAYTIWYSDKTSPGAVGGADWSKSMDAANVRAVAIDFGDSEMKPGAQLNLYIKMTAPMDDELKGKITENGFSASFTMEDAVTGNETKFDMLTSNFVQVKLTSALKNLVLTKEDEVSNERLSDAVYSLVNKETGEVIATETTNSNGQIVFKNLPSDVVYIFREDEAPYGYELGEDYEINFEEGDTTRITLKEKRKKGSMIITKTNELDSLLKVKGAEYTLFSKEGEEIQKAETDINGKISFENIEWGEYYIQETKAPEGYKLSETKYSVSVNRENVSVVQKFNPTDKQDGYTAVSLVKYVMTTTGVQTEIPIAGAGFQLVRVTGGQNNVLGTYVTDKNGEIIVEDLAYGDYIFRESRVPSGYEKTENVPFAVSPDNKEIGLIAYDKRKTGSIHVHKIDELDNVVEGAVFELYDETQGNVLGTYTTDRAGNISISDLEWGTYYLREKSTLECYVLDQSWVEVEIGGASLNVNMTRINETKKGSVVLVKTDEIGNNKLSDAEFSLYKEDGSLLQTGLKTDANGELKVEGLAWGKYYFKETKAPAGYGLTDETIRFAVNSMNAGIEQALYVTNPMDAKTIILTKKIKAEDINFDNGDPTFLLKLHGTDVNGNEHTYYRIVKFNEGYVNGAVDEDGFVSQSVTVSGLLAGVYTASEEDSSRYSLDDITDLSSNAVLQDDSVVIDITTEAEGKVTFVNGKYEWADYSDNKAAANSLKTQAKLTGLKAKWTGDLPVPAKAEIDRSKVEVTAIYDDGSTRIISTDDWSLGADFYGVKFPNINGDYQIPVTYTENGITRNDSFDVTIAGAVEKSVIRIEATVNEEFVVPGSAITQDMFEVTAIYDDNSREVLLFEYPVITSPNWPDNYPNNMSLGKDYWEVTFDGASSIKVKFDSTSRTENITTDYIIVSYKSGVTQYQSKFGGTSFAGYSYIISGDHVKIAMQSNSSTTYKGFSAQLTPLDADGKAIPTKSCITDRTEAPSEEGVFEVQISLNQDDFDEDVSGISTTVNMLAKHHDPILTEGESFYGKIPSSATSVVFTDEVAPNGVTTVDLSKDENNAVVGWLDGTVWKVSAQRTGTKAIADTSCAKMFYGKTKLTQIDLSYLDTSNTTTMDSMFNGCSGLKEVNLSGLNTSNVTTMSSMFQGCSGLTSVDLSGLNTSNVTTMASMFQGCSKLTSISAIDFSGLDTSNVILMDSMFKGCSKLTSVDLSGIDTSNVISMYAMFQGCSKLTNIDFLKDIDTSNVTSMASMFDRCSGLTSVDLSGLDLSNVTIIGSMFSYCSKLTSIDLSGLDLSNVQNMYGMFDNCSSLTSADLSGLDLSNVQTIEKLFYNCKSLISADLSGTDLSSVYRMNYMFAHCSSLVSVDLSGWNTAKLSVTNNAFQNCTAVKEAYARTQTDADKFNAISNKPTTWSFIVK